MEHVKNMTARCLTMERASQLYLIGARLARMTNQVNLYKV